MSDRSWGLPPEPCTPVAGQIPPPARAEPIYQTSSYPRPPEQSPPNADLLADDLAVNLSVPAGDGIPTP
ncbi:MAG: hypothetical protein ABIP19_07000 [Dermatophilaceae bacterium]